MTLEVTDPVGEPSIVIVRHGDTEWSRTHRHTSTTDLSLLPEGVERAKGLAGVLNAHEFALVLSSPLKRALETAELTGYGDQLEVCDDLTEWSYGELEGLTTPQILERTPGWNLWVDGAPGGETPDAVAARAELVIERAMAAGGDALLFAHGHILRVLAARWVGEGPEFGSRIYLAPATICRLGHEHGRRVIDRWNASSL